jgi:DNA-binding beta-propeller fold protein YncE
MKPEKIKLILLLTMAIVLGAFTNSFASDNVEWDVYKTLKLEESPIDVAVSPDGKRIFVLTDQGKVVIYSSSGNMEAQIDVGKHVNQLKLGPRGDSLILSSGKNKTVEIVTIDFIQKINVSDSPFKGPEDAAVVIAVFDDFE